VLQLFQRGTTKKEIARLLNIDVKTVRSIIRKGDNMAKKKRTDAVVIDEERLRAVYQDCKGWMQRVYEVLTEEDKLSIGYSTLTRRCRELGLSLDDKDERSVDGELLVKPGREMQHDTSPFWTELGGIRRKVVASGLYYRYCKIRFVKFYFSFDRFHMKCFLFEGLTYFGYSAHECWIDNTNLAVLSGTGKRAVMVPEMAAFGKNLGFKFCAHELNHPDRKAGKERNFFTLETNFFPGRKFKDLTDLNEQAKEWSTERYFKRPHSKTKLIPAEVFEIEKPHLNCLPEVCLPPYRERDRPTDRKGYVTLRANYYWVPGKSIREMMKLIETPDRLKIYRGHECVANYPIVAADKRGEKMRPEGVSIVPERPQHDRINSSEEEKRLRAISQSVAEYLDWLQSTKGLVRYRNPFIRELYQCSKRMTPRLFSDALEQARQHGIAQVDAIVRIADIILRTQDSADTPWLTEPTCDDYMNRKTFEEGRFSEEPQLSMYADLFEGQKDPK